MSKYREIVGRINYGLFLALVALLPFPQIYLRYAFVLWLVAWLLEGRWLRKSNLRSPMSNYQSIPFLLFGLWFAWKVLSVCWAADYDAWAWQMERYMTFALLIPVGLWGVNEHYDRRQTGKVLAMSCVVAIPLYLLWMAALYHHPEWIAYLDIREPWTHHADWWVFLSDNISHFKHRLFLCSVEMLGAVTAILVWKEKRWVWMLTVPVMLSSIFLTGSRQAILTAAAMVVAGILCIIPHKYRLRYGMVILLLGVLVGGGLLHLHPRMRQFDMHAITEMRDVSYEHDVRFNIYGCALQQPSDYVAYGLGAGQSTAYLMEKYQEKGFDYYIFKHYHAHNQYLEELMEIGIPGLLLFVLAWLSIPVCARKENRVFALLFFTMYGMNMLTDCMFGKFDGIALWAFGMVYLLLPKQTTAPLSFPSRAA